ncbi:MAG: 50S ribosomal protein L15 [Candidatus Omnitrophota bacterium]|nr:50S ribosomal protein L15 [Candidatus Omnitrophota bacterium]
MKSKTSVKKIKKTELDYPQLVGLFNLKTPAGAHKGRKYLGRGSSSGHGKTSTRGSKGQTSRAGRHFYLGFEGGQSPLIRKMPKRGFNSNFKKEYQIVNLANLAKIKEAIINPELLRAKGLIKDEHKLVKILGEGVIKNPLTVQAHAFSKKASEEIKKAGGIAEIILLRANV